MRGWIEEFQPDVVLTGHVHESPFKSDGSWMDRIGNTWVFNAGHQIGKVPAFIELDLSGATGYVGLHHGHRIARHARAGCSGADGVLTGPALVRSFWC